MNLKISFCLLYSTLCGLLAAQDSVVVSTTLRDSVYTFTITNSIDSAKVDSFYKTKQIDVSLADNPQLYYEVFKWLGTKYCYAGTSSSGIDCSGFVSKICKMVYGKELPHSSAGMFTVCQPLPQNDVLAEGDLVFFKIKKGRISHVGIYLQHGKFAHASIYSGVTINDLSETYYQRYFFRAGRLE